jgi:hypothetical protein
LKKYQIEENKILKPFVKWPKRQQTQEMIYEDYPISFNITRSKIYPDVEHISNSMNFRSDEFKTHHDRKHIVFSGCSVTEGSGLNIEETWSYKLYEKISKKEQCSGYFNLGVSGSSITNEIITLFKYFNTYGNPDVIFINFPDFYRFYAYSVEYDVVSDAAYDYNSEPLLKIMAYEYYFMLEQYCKTNNIKLFSFTWMPKDLELDGYLLTGNGSDYPLEKFNTFYKINEQEIILWVDEYIKNNKNINNLEFARDNEHYGIAYHEYWSDFIYKKYLENK